MQDAGPDPTSRLPDGVPRFFYEIPVPRPWTKGQELEAYHAVLDAAILGDQYGFHSIWTVEHHFFEEISHCSAPDALYGAIASAHREHPDRARRAAAPLPLQPPRARRRGRRGRRPHVEGTARVRHRPIRVAHRDRGLPDRPAPDAWDVGRGARCHREGVDRGRARVGGGALLGATTARAPRPCRNRIHRYGARPPAPTGTS